MIYIVVVLLLGVFMVLAKVIFQLGDLTEIVTEEVERSAALRQKLEPPTGARFYPTEASAPAVQYVENFI